MRFTYRLTREPGGWLAECVETSAAGEGRTPQEAIAELREALAERMLRPDAIAPPELPPLAGKPTTIELMRVE